MNKEQLNSVLDKHKKWLNDEEGGERASLRDASLRYADLCGADLRGASLRDANLRDADLRDANLRDANLDYSCWPLWCGSLKSVVDDRIARQLLYHVLSVIECSPLSQDIKDAALTPELLAVANGFHRAEECGKIGENEDE